MVDDLTRALMDDLRSVYGGRSWILAWDVLAASTPFVNQLLGMGATRVFALAGSEGTGPTPNVPSFLLGVGGVSVMEAIRAAEAAMANLPDAAQTAVEAFDPQRTAHVLRPMFGALDFVAGRPVFGSPGGDFVGRACAFWDAPAPLQLCSRSPRRACFRAPTRSCT